MSRALPWIIGVVVFLALAAGGWYGWQTRSRPAALPEPAIPGAAAPAPGPEAASATTGPVQHPIEQARPEAPAASEPPPAMADSDKFIRDALVDLLGRDAVLSHFNVGEYIRRVVATVDNLPRRHAPVRLWPVNTTVERFMVIERHDTATIDPANARRYDAFVKVVEAADTGRFVGLYVRLYPLFQQAYADLGHPDRHFNDRLVEVIDHLLAAPEVGGPIQVMRPQVKESTPGVQAPPLWSHADPRLEGLSAGHRILVRVGAENAARLKAKLRELRRQITTAPPKP